MTPFFLQEERQSQCCEKILFIFCHQGLNPRCQKFIEVYVFMCVCIYVNSTAFVYVYYYKIDIPVCFFEYIHLRFNLFLHRMVT